jgi:hypothetical protein
LLYFCAEAVPCLIEIRVDLLWFVESCCCSPVLTDNEFVQGMAAGDNTLEPLLMRRIMNVTAKKVLKKCTRDTHLRCIHPTTQASLCSNCKV